MSIVDELKFCTHVQTFAGTGHPLADEQPAVVEAIRAFARSAAGV